MVYPNLVAESRYAWNVKAMARGAGVSAELMAEVLKGNESLTATEGLSLARYMFCDYRYLFSPSLSTLSRSSNRHKQWMEELNRGLYEIWYASKDGDSCALEYMNTNKRTRYVNMSLCFRDGRQVTYAEYKDVKLEMDATLERIREKRRPLRRLKTEKSSESPTIHRSDDGWEMVDAELRVLSSPISGLPQWVKDDFLRDTPYDDIRSLTFFYSPKTDAVVLNRDHKNADLYELLVTTYLGIGEEQRRRLREEVPGDLMETALGLLDHVIEERSKHA